MLINCFGSRILRFIVLNYDLGFQFINWIPFICLPFTELWDVLGRGDIFLILGMVFLLVHQKKLLHTFLKLLEAWSLVHLKVMWWKNQNW